MESIRIRHAGGPSKSYRSRCAAAKTMLTETDLRLTDIANRLGVKVQTVFSCKKQLEFKHNKPLSAIREAFSASRGEKVLAKRKINVARPKPQKKAPRKKK